MQKEGKKQMLIIDPKNEIAFKGPYDHVVTQYFTLKNPSESTIAFKVKTTAPKRYCVRPNNGQVAAHQTVQVAVMLQPGDLTQEKHKHKFMIQSVVVPANTNNQTNVDDLFKSASPDEIMDSKFKCVFLDAGEKPITSTNIGQLQTSNTNSNTTTPLTSTTNNFDTMDDNNIMDDNSAQHNLINGGSGGQQQQTGNVDLTSASGDYDSDHHPHQLMNDYQPDEQANYSTAKISGSNLKHRNNNKALITAGGGSSNQQVTPLKHSSSDYAPTNIVHHDSNLSQEAELKMAHEEIRKLKEKLHEVQNYARKFAQSSDVGAKSGLQQNNQLLFQRAAIIGVVAFLIGIICAKLLI